MSELFVGTMMAVHTGSSQDRVIDHHGHLIIDSPDRRAMPEFSLHAELLDPRIIVAENELQAQENIASWLAAQCPKNRGWSNYDVTVKNISEDVKMYLSSMPPSGGHPFGFYAIGGIGLKKKDPSGLLIPYGVSGASSGTDAYHAYGRFKELALNGDFFTAPNWIGGAVRIILVPEEQLLDWQESWINGYLLRQMQRTPKTSIH